jgi:hypothetical protein
MTKQNVYEINKILETVEIPDDNVMLETLLELAEEKQAA